MPRGRNRPTSTANDPRDSTLLALGVSPTRGRKPCPSRPSAFRASFSDCQEKCASKVSDGGVQLNVVCLGCRWPTRPRGGSRMPGIDVPTSLTLVNGLRDPGNGGAWRAFLDRYQALISVWCRRLGLNCSDTEEVSAAVLAKLVEGIRSYDP